MCFIIYCEIINVSKHKLNSLRNIWNLNVFVWFLWKFSMIFADFWIWILFIEVDPDRDDQKETDPNGSGSETLRDQN